MCQVLGQRSIRAIIKLTRYINIKIYHPLAGLVKTKPPMGHYTNINSPPRDGDPPVPRQGISKCLNPKI